MVTSTHTHEELATKKDVDERFDRVEARLDRLEERIDRMEVRLDHLTSSLASLLNAYLGLNDRLTAVEENQRTMIQMLERIENSTNRQIGF